MSILNQTSLTIIGGWNTQNCWRCWFLPWNHWQWDEFNNINNQHHTKAISVRIVDQPQAMFIAWLSIRTQLLSTVTTLADPTSVPWRSDGGDGLMRGDMLPGWLEILRIIEPYQHCESKQFLFFWLYEALFFFREPLFLCPIKGPMAQEDALSFSVGGIEAYLCSMVFPIVA